MRKEVIGVILLGVFVLVFTGVEYYFGGFQEDVILSPGVQVVLEGKLDITFVEGDNPDEFFYHSFIVLEDGERIEIMFITRPQEILRPGAAIEIKGEFLDDKIIVDGKNNFDIREEVTSRTLRDILDPEYQQYFAENPDVADLTINIYDTDTLSYFWQYIEELEGMGNVSIDEPIESQNCVEPEECLYINLTSDEKKKIIAAKAAHSIWLDKNQMLSWSLADYSAEELNGLFHECLLFQNCERYFSVVDYSPSPIYHYVLGKGLIQDNMEDTVYAVLDDLRTDFRHGSSSYGDPRNTAYTLEDAITTYVQSPFTPTLFHRISRKGCWSMTRIAVGIFRSINIPGERESLPKWLGGHSYAEWPALEKVLIHGDDIYAGPLRNTPSRDLLMPYKFFEQHKILEPCASQTAFDWYQPTCVSVRYYVLNAVRYPTQDLIDICNNPMDYGYTSCEHYLAEFGCYYLSTGSICGLTSHEFEEAVDCIYNGCACGNGIIEFGEICDDGNREDGDGCDRNCLIENVPETEWIYQENPSDYLCDNYTGYWSSGCSLVVDGDWDTYDHGVFATINISYDKPGGAVGDSVWQVKTGENNISNKTIPQSCWDQEFLKFQILSNIFGNNQRGTIGYCWDGNGWNELWNDVASDYERARVYEEAMWWLVGQPDIIICPKDARVCPDGSTVGRDSDNNCEFYDCPSSPPLGGGSDVRRPIRPVEEPETTTAQPSREMRKADLIRPSPPIGESYRFCDYVSWC